MEFEETPQQNIVGDYELFDLIGKGTFASVWEGVHRVTHATVAIKQFIFSQFNGEDVAESMEREVRIMKMLDHPFIIGLYDVIRTEDALYIVMENAENGTLLDYVNKQPSFNEDKIRKIFVQIVSVLQYLHKEKRIAHRDLKAENILLDRMNNIKIIDFGLSNVLNQNTSCLNTACGSPGMYFFFYFLFFLRYDLSEKKRGKKIKD